MKKNYTPEEGCLYHAHSEEECNCNVDWTPREVYELREQRDMLAEALQELWDNHTLHGAAYELIEQTLAAVKGGQP